MAVCGSAYAEEKAGLENETVMVEEMLALPDDEAGPEAEVVEEEAFPVTFGLDLVSRYVWRGVDFGATPAVQPSLAYAVGDKVGFEIGAWASYGITGAFAEMDLYATLSFPYISLSVIDYFFPNEAVSDDQYFNYKDGETGHVYEGLIGLEGPEKAPISFTFAYNFYGADPDNSIYMELAYPFSFKHDVAMDIFVAGATGAYYTQSGDFNVVNVGLTFSKDIEIGKKFKLPLSASLITNPDAQKVYFVAGVGLWSN